MDCGVGSGSSSRGHWSLTRRAECERAVRSVAVLMGGLDAEQVLEVPPARICAPTGFWPADDAAGHARLRASRAAPVVALVGRFQAVSGG